MDMNRVRATYSVDNKPILDWANIWIFVRTLMEIVMPIYHKFKIFTHYQWPHPKHSDVLVFDKWKVSEWNTKDLFLINFY
jgi:hypothetical protein